MINSQEFNPFNILPQPLMLHILLHTFTEDGKCSLDSILDYQKANHEFSAILSDETNLRYILNSMPIEFNIGLITSLKRRKITTEEGRYRAGLALLFLKYLYEHVKPFPDDDFLINHYNDYHNSFKYLQEYFFDYPMPMYVSSIVAFYISKRLLTLDALDKNLREKGAEIFKIAIYCIKRADELEHPLAKIFYADMVSQLQRLNVRIEDYIKSELQDVLPSDTSDLISLLGGDTPIDMSAFNDETKTLITVTWRKLIIEQCAIACDLFKFAYQNNKIVQLTDFFYTCYQVNHFHRHILAYNPLFVHSENKESLLYLLDKFSVASLVTLHQAFRVSQPNPDSVLLSTLLMLNKNELNDNKTLISETLSLPQKGNAGWKICFHDAYRNAVDEGMLKSVSFGQMKLILHYFILVNQGGLIDSILERDASIVNCILHSQNDQVQNIALAVLKQMNDFTRANVFTHLHHKEILLKVVYQNDNYLSRLKVSTVSDITKFASIIVDTFAELIVPKLPDQEDFKVYDFLFNNKPLFLELTDAIHAKLKEFLQLNGS